jgi:hypothetical protein
LPNDNLKNKNGGIILEFVALYVEISEQQGGVQNFEINRMNVQLIPWIFL